MATYDLDINILDIVQYTISDTLTKIYKSYHIKNLNSNSIDILSITTSLTCINILKNISTYIININDIFLLLYKSKYILNIQKSINTDTVLNFYPIENVQLFDIQLTMNQPIMKYYDILVSPFITINIDNFENLKKGDNPFDFMVTDTTIINNETMTMMKALGRDFGYFKNKSEEYGKPLGMVDEYKPITQGITKTKIDTKFYCVKFKTPHSLNLTSNWIEGVFSAKYTNINNKYSTSHIDLMGRYNKNLLKRYGISKTVEVPKYLESNTINIISFWLKVNTTSIWFLKLESDGTAQLLIDNKLIIENYNTNTYGTSTYVEYKMSEGYYKFLIRSENISKTSGCILSFFNKNSISWKNISTTNLGSDGELYAYIPTDLSELYLSGLVEMPLNDKYIIPDVDYVFVNYRYYQDFYKAIYNNFINVKNIGIPTADTSDTIYQLSYIKDTNSVSAIGWANNTTKNNGQTYFGYTFTNGIENFIMLDWFEYSDYSFKDDNFTKTFTSNDTKSSCVKIKLVYMDTTYEYLSISDIDIPYSKNISSNSKNNFIYKNTTQGHTIIKLKNKKEKSVKSVLIYRWDNIKKYWGIITELNVYVKDSYDLLTELVLIDSNNTEHPITEIVPSSVTAFGFYNIPLDNSIDITTSDIEMVSKSNIITLYHENNTPSIKYNMLNF